MVFSNFDNTLSPKTFSSEEDFSMIQSFDNKDDFSNHVYAEYSTTSSDEEDNFYIEESIEEDFTNSQAEVYLYQIDKSVNNHIMYSIGPFALSLLSDLKLLFSFSFDDIPTESENNLSNELIYFFKLSPMKLVHTTFDDSA
jgi:hypothetical protein